MTRKNLLIAIFLPLLFIAAGQASWATRIPVDVREKLEGEFPGAKVRLDGSCETQSGALFVPLVPASSWKKYFKSNQELMLPSSANPYFVLYPDGWCYLKVVRRGDRLSVFLPEELPEKLRKQVLASSLPSDFIVPEHFFLPKSLACLSGETSVGSVDDKDLAEDMKMPGSTGKSGEGSVFVSSMGHGTIAELALSNLNKENEYPTEGTPGAMIYIHGKLFIADQAKDRILVLDPEHHNFLGQIDLGAKSHPKGMACLPNGRLIYVAEAGTSDIAVIETETEKVLLKTKVPAGPSKIATTPDGNTLLVLNVPSGMITFISTVNQAVISSLQVGVMPGYLAVSPNSKFAYVSCRQSNCVSVVDLASKKVVATIATGNGPTGIALSGDNSKIYVANARENTIALYDLQTRQKVQDVKLPLEIDFPGAIKLMPDGKHLLITSEASETVCYLNCDKFDFEDKVNIGHSTHEILFVPTM